MSVWERYSSEERKLYIRFLEVYGALSNLFRQKKGDPIPYLDSKFQETVFAKIFRSQTVDIGNTPHDVLSIFGDERIGIGIKTWMGSQPSFQKVMQLKRYQEEIKETAGHLEDLARKISEIKNERMRIDYNRLGLSEDKNIYHYVTRDQGQFSIHESAYPLIDLDNLRGFHLSPTSFCWNDGRKEYKYTFSDAQIWQKFDAHQKDSSTLEQFSVKIIDNPFDFLLRAYTDLISQHKEEESDFVEVFLPLYSYHRQEVEEKSGLNAWNAAPKSKHSDTPRPLNEVYIPIPRIFHKKHPDFFTQDIFRFEKERMEYVGDPANKPEVRFHLQLPNGKRIPALVTQSNMKGLQSGSNTEYDEQGKRYGQSALGQWLLVDVLGLTERKLVTRSWLQKKGTDAVRLWRKRGDYSTIFIDFAPIGAFERFINSHPIEEQEPE